MSLIFYLFIFIFGAIIGSFLNVVIIRLKKNESLIKKRSHCPCCRHELRWRDLLPIISFFVLKGRCHYCRVKISWQYPIVEFITGWLFVLVVYQTGGLTVLAEPFLFLFLFLRFFLISSLLIVFFSDLFFMVVYDAVIYWTAGIYFAFLLLCNIFVPSHLLPFLGNVLLAVFIGVAFFGVQYLVSKGRWIGSGDILIGLLMGVILGFPNIILAIFLAYFGGAIISLILLLSKKAGSQSQIPLAVFLVPATLIAYFFGQAIIDWYISML